MFSTKSNLKKHMQKFHPDRQRLFKNVDHIPKSSLLCEVKVEDIFKSKSYVDETIIIDENTSVRMDVAQIQSLQRSQPKKKKSFTCYICDRTFSEQRKLKEHVDLCWKTTVGSSENQNILPVDAEFASGQLSDFNITELAELDETSSVENFEDDNVESNGDINGASAIDKTAYQQIPEIEQEHEEVHHTIDDDVESSANEEIQRKNHIVASTPLPEAKKDSFEQMYVKQGYCTIVEEESMDEEDWDMELSAIGVTHENKKDEDYEVTILSDDESVEGSVGYTEAVEILDESVEEESDLPMKKSNAYASLQQLVKDSISGPETVNACHDQSYAETYMNGNGHALNDYNDSSMIVYVKGEDSYHIHSSSNTGMHS